MFHKGDRIRLKRTNYEGVGNTGDEGVITSLLFKDVDGYDVVVRFDNGKTEGFRNGQIEKVLKSVDTFQITRYN